MHSCNSTKNTQTEASKTKIEASNTIEKPTTEKVRTVNNSKTPSKDPLQPDDPHFAPIDTDVPKNTADEAIMTKIDKMANQLNLDDSKKKKLKTLSFHLINDLSDIRSGKTNVNRAELGKTLIARVNTFKNDVHQFLNEDQIATFDKIMSESRDFLGPGMGRDWD